MIHSIGAWRDPRKGGRDVRVQRGSAPAWTWASLPWTSRAKPLGSPDVISSLFWAGGSGGSVGALRAPAEGAPVAESERGELVVVGASAGGVESVSRLL